MYYYNIGQTVKVPLLDPGNEEYVSRVETLGGVVAGIVEKWETIQDQMKKEKASHLAYTLRKLAELLSSSDLLQIAEQPFFRKASIIMEKWDLESNETHTAEKAMKVLCSGLDKIHNRLDLGLSPFDAEPSGGQGKPSIEERELCARSMIQEFQLRRNILAVLTN